MAEPDPKALFDQSLQAQRQGRDDDAIALYNTLLARAPNHLPAYNNLGVALRKTERFAEAVACYRRSLEADPDNPQTLSNLGNALKDLHRLDEAIATLRRAVGLRPDDAGIVYNLGIALKDAGRLDEALAQYARAQSLRPDDRDIPWDTALALLAKPDFARGWPAYESRWRLKDVVPPAYAQPRWDGAPLGGRRILLTSEQGFGDSLQFARFIPRVKALGGHVIVETRPPLARLLATVQGIDEIAVAGVPTPAFDMHCPLLSLPMVLRTDLRDLPGPIPYMAPPAGAGAKVDAFLAPVAGRLKVGLVWSGSVTFKNNRNRATTLRAFLPLLETPGVAFVSLQKGPPIAELQSSGCRGLLLDADPIVDDFADTAALLERLDLVIMTDSAVAHLAGALGRPVWVLLCYAADWRWLRERDDSPWYPSMRLYRQKTPGRWDDVIARVQKDLAKLASPAPAKPKPPSTTRPKRGARR
jgi:hypothetical protein